MMRWRATPWSNTLDYWNKGGLWLIIASYNMKVMDGDALVSEENLSLWMNATMQQMRNFLKICIL